MLVTLQNKFAIQSKPFILSDFNSRLNPTAILAQAKGDLSVELHSALLPPKLALKKVSQHAYKQDNPLQQSPAILAEIQLSPSDTSLIKTPLCLYVKPHYQPTITNNMCTNFQTKWFVLYEVSILSKKLKIDCTTEGKSLHEGSYLTAKIY